MLKKFDEIVDKITFYTNNLITFYANNPITSILLKIKEETFDKTYTYFKAKKKPIDPAEEEENKRQEELKKNEMKKKNTF